MFRPEDVDVFRCVSWDVDESGLVSFHYAFDEAISFTETILLGSVADLPAARRAALDRCLAVLHAVIGVSYYKAATPKRVRIESQPLSDATVEYLRSVYGEGLGEFAYVNGISIPRPAFEYEVRDPAGNAAGISQRPLVAVGGGKDSCVSIEALRNFAPSPLLASVNSAKPIRETIEASGFEFVSVERTLSQALFAINKEGALNGHIPVTAIVSLILCAKAIVEDCGSLVMSNERSASSGNMVHDGIEINHQYSKSIEAERALSNVITSEIASDLQYFSLLRPLSELAIAKRFADTTRYDKVFTSCNRAFHIDEARRIDHWCCDCPKCRFVFLALAPFASKQRLVDIFGRDMLDDRTQIAGFDALIGWNAHKPFECVGEVEESVAAFLSIAESEDWRDSYLVKRFVDELLPQLVLPDGVKDRPFVESAEHNIPQAFLKELHATG